MYLWENLILAGGLSALPGLKPRLEKESELYLSASETSNENQAKEVGWVKIPDYFLSFKDRAQDMAFVGASVVAKVMFLSTANYITKVCLWRVVFIFALINHHHADRLQ
jgi:actin-related protein